MKSKKGFVLLETVIVLIVIIVAMLGLYTTYSFVFKNLKQAQKYDNINDIYKLNVFYKIRKQSNLDGISSNFVKITSSNCSTYFNDSNCSSIMSDLGFNYFLYTKVGVDKVLVGSLSGLSNTDIDYIKSLEFRFKFLIGVRCESGSCSGNDNHYVYLKAGTTE